MSDTKDTKDTWYSLNDEDFIYEDLFGLFEEMKSNGDFEIGATYYEADFRRMKASDVVNVHWILEEINEQIYDIVGDFAIDSFQYKGKVEELQKLIEDWINSNTNISEFYRVVGNSREKKITQEEFEDYKE